MSSILDGRCKVSHVLASYLPGSVSLLRYIIPVVVRIEFLRPSAHLNHLEVALVECTFHFVIISNFSTAGVLTTYASWRWAFYLQAILTVVFVGMVFFFVPSDSRQVSRREPIDWFGAFLVSAGLCAICFALTDAETTAKGWATPYIIVAILLGTLCIALFLWLQARLRYPLMPYSIWRYPQFPRVILTYFLGFTTFAGVLVFNYSLCWQLVYKRNAVGVRPHHQLRLTIGGYLEYSFVGNGSSNKFHRVIHSTPSFGNYTSDSGRVGHLWRCSSSSSPTTKPTVLGNDLPIPPFDDCRCRILLPRVLVVRA
jgi:MFS family permease